MDTKTIIMRLDEILKPLRFARQKVTWNRKSGSYVDVINIQTSKARDAITINAGVAHLDVYTKCWGNEPPTFIQEPLCIVRARVGQLIKGKHLWWRLSDSGIIDDMIENITLYMIPFLEQMHSFKEMEQFLINGQVMKQTYPLPKIHLAILRYEQGDRTGSCDLLRELHKKAGAGWQTRISQVLQNIACS